MELLKDTPMEAAWQVWQARPPQASLTVVVKATYALVESGVAALADRQALPTGDEHHDDDPERSLRYASDLDPLKPHGECFAVGSVRLPGGAPFERTEAALAVGPVRKRLSVFGDRVWRQGRATAPAAVTAVPLAWEHAFGGPGVAANPVGCGTRPRSGEEAVRLPHLEDPERPLVARDARVPPAGLSPIPRTWEARMRHAGTYDALWQRTRYPWYPEDLDWRFFCAAPAEQQIQGHWRGDEEIALTHLHPEHAKLRCRLPGHAAHAYLVSAETKQPRPVGLRLDTIVVDADEGVARCVWRGVVEVPNEDLSDFSHLFVLHAGLDEPVDAAARFEAKLAADAAAEAELTASPVPDLTPEPESEAPSLDAPDAPTPTDPAAQLDPAAPGFRWAHLDQAMTLRGEDDATQRVLREAMAMQARKGGMEGVLDDPLGLGKPVSVDRKLTPEELLELEMVFALGDLLSPKVDERRQAVRDAVAAGESLAGQDLAGVDLSGVGLVDADFRGAILTRANLSGAHLERCRFDGANLSEAELSLGSFDGCDLTEADLTSVRAHRVRFHQCRLVDAAVRSSYLREARFMSCDLTRAELCDSDATESDFRDCDLTDADLSACLLPKAVFARSRLIGTWLEGGVDARGAVFDGCEATKLRASEGANLEGASFKKAILDGARFGGARLRGATFNLARLSRADFSEAVLHQAHLMGCDLRMARFDGASLLAATLLKSNLMQARFEGAALKDADLRGTNLFEAELLGADLERARLDLANTVGTRIGGSR